MNNLFPKVVIVDWSIFLHRAAYASKFNKAVPPTYTAMRMLVSCLHRIGLDKDTIVIIACDGRGNWRKEIVPEYKGQRKKMRDDSGLDWNKIFKDFDKILQKLYWSTNWNILRIDRCEADDIASVCVRFFNDREVVLLSYDSDWELLWFFENVKIFSQHPKVKSYKIKPNNFNAYELLAHKCEQEKKENLNEVIVQGSAEWEKRKIVKNLMELPEFVDEIIISKLKESLDHPRELKLNEMPFRGLYNDYLKMYSSDKVITYEDAITEKDKKKKRALRKKSNKVIKEDKKETSGLFN